MCGRITQTREIRDYAREAGWTESDLWMRDVSGYVATFNAPPGVKHLVFREHRGHQVVEMVHWGYLSPWAKEKAFGQAINAKREKLLGGYYRSMMKTGRVIVPVDGWYEWTGEKGNKQPWYIRAKTGAPLFLAALTNHFPDKDDPEGAGFVIVTNDVAGGMIDVHDRRPVALSAEDARLWMDLSISIEQAEQIVRTSALTEDYFEWYRVSTEVNSVRHDDARLIDAI